MAYYRHADDFKAFIDDLITPDKTMKQMSIEGILNHIRKYGGITLSSDTWDHYSKVEHKSGYMVGSCSFPSRELPSDSDASRLLKALDYAKADAMHAAEIDSLTDFYVGAWLSNGSIIVDISFHVEDKIDAIGLGFTHEQEAIYDCKNESEIHMTLSTKIINNIAKFLK